MDLRRFLVFFVLVFFLFSINIYSSSIFDIENIQLPENLRDYKYIIGYSPYSQGIFMATYKYNAPVSSFYLKNDGVFDEHGNRLMMLYEKYNPDTGVWGEGQGVWSENAPWSIDGSENALKPYFSNIDVYYNDEIYILGKEHHNNLGVLSGLSSSVLFVNLLKPFLDLMPFILVFIVLIFAFLKAWNFIKGVF